MRLSVFEVTYTYTDAFSKLFSSGDPQVLVAYWYDDDYSDAYMNYLAQMFFRSSDICGDPNVKLISTEIKRV